MRKLFGAALATLTATMGALTAATPPAKAVGPSVAPSCGTVTAPGMVRCFALRRTDLESVRTIAEAATPSGFGPSDLRSAYSLPPSGGRGATVAVVVAYDNPKAEADLAVYRSQYGLPPCTTANGCFRKVNGKGQTSPLPTADPSWAAETSLDIDMVSAICPRCRILLVEADSAEYADVFGAINTAVSLGAKYVSASWGAPEFSGQTMYDSYLNHPGVAIAVSTGDGFWGAQYPATSPYVTAVGGTTLSRSTSRRGWTESAWIMAESGCSAYESKPAWQTVTTGCSRRAAADVSAVADPATGVAVYDTYGGEGWSVYGGTSAAAPIIASVYALAGSRSRSDYPASYPYARQRHLNDVTSGSNGGNCGAPLCEAGTGWDGPTGLGTPNGVRAFR